MAWHPFRNIGLKVAALGLGTLVWFTVSGPRVERSISGVPVIYRNVPASLEISDQTEEASAHVRGTDSQIRRLQPGDLVVEIDLAGERPGLVVLPLRTDQVTVPFGIEVTEVSPGAVTLTLEESASVRGSGPPDDRRQACAGLRRRGDEGRTARRSPSSARPAVSRRPRPPITQRVSIEGARDTVTQIVTVGVIDPGLRLKDPRTARVTVPIEPVEDRTICGCEDGLPRPGQGPPRRGVARDGHGRRALSGRGARAPAGVGVRCRSST